ncbi:Protein of unknown function [Gryllus bimaculatus]|nr:Protein of unknown function [Gryllus bimaculatus]
MSVAVTPDLCAQATIQTEIATSCVADAYASLVNGLLILFEVSLQVLMDVSHDPCTIGDLSHSGR